MDTVRRCRRLINKILPPPAIEHRQNGKFASENFGGRSKKYSAIMTGVANGRNFGYGLRNESADSARLGDHRDRFLIVTGLKQNAALSPGIHGADRGWAPRLSQEARLRQLEDELARHAIEGCPVETEIERAVLLGALNREPDARQAFVDILRLAPTNFSALNEFGTLLTNMGAIEAACRVYSEAIAHHPDNPIGHVNLANLLLRANRHGDARAHYEAVLRIDP